MSPYYLEFNELPSTHDYAIELVSKTKPKEGTVIVAAHQTSGRGRHDRAWQSDHGNNLLLSCIIYPTHLTVKESFFLNITSTLATTYLLDNHHIKDYSVKWPNDVLIRDRKIAGVLIQNQLAGKRLSSSVVSIGLNVNQTKWQPGIPATSLSGETEIYFDCSEIAKEWTSHFVTCYERTMTEDGRNVMMKEWLSILHGFNELKRYVASDKRVFQGTLIGILPDGRLQVVEEDHVRTYHMDEIRYFGHRS